MGTALKPKSTRARKARSVKPSPVTALKGIFEPKAPATPPSLLPLSREQLRVLHKRLDVAIAAAIVCARGLDQQRADGDPDVALVLRTCISDPLSGELDLIERTLSGGAA